ncbi:histone acetyltransferase, putative [Entamoeba histolytica HM-1:IMSS-B]|uniref:Elongator complex protein 3 n=6 Tax=Entamoeba histolytica TaxID=5759 RepID=C4LSP0_ENTH1|nr:histone acetyltransferase, putative [Entamoeba histolytica HM-1:IMSS]EMD46605.1 histone acetyltransferase, putative [Entamoeba histolytica KU27]EMH76378.1 histone acetyltransferase, putative [Entamoeba histolytica HM-1:IMSS-B]EMS17245.1 histone acetyltransferase, putative [Entamoeba histolytica HM-3:IMSS]ENY59883.1 histone acetyltransferase, putative [Entamoeba histolytica HM-1:IMSS-A]GAT91451.1 histone acetyltransferase putative [Entamoeba histolytica]|eukprot:XP_657379.1 histone acetyltransferase, putative [Entamoeba histolytica HM-1:IMSS]
MKSNVIRGRKGPAKYGRNSVQFVACINEIVQVMIDLYEKGEEINLNKLKSQMAQKHNLHTAPKQVDIIAAIPDSHRPFLLPIVKSKPVRTASGIVAIAVMCKPHRCPNIRTNGDSCVYCPGGCDSDFEYSTQSYTGYEPTSMRAVRARYNPYIQSRSRVEQLQKLGHSVEKVEYIIMGGTFLSMDKHYRDSFILGLFDALSGHVSSTVEEAVHYGENSKVKCVALTIETRPDCCSEDHIREMFRYGTTRLEIGLQSIFEDICKECNRGHTVQDCIGCYKRLKDAGYKIVTHMMPNLPGVPPERDVFTYSEMFSDGAYQCDGLKLYPCLVIRGTRLYEMWRKGHYHSYTSEETIDVLSRILALIPPWVRVHRIQRDIPIPLVSAGADKGNLREYVQRQMDANNWPCRDTRTREVGIAALQGKPGKKVKCVKDIELIRRDYVGSDGWETFLSYEDPENDLLIGLLRLRLPTNEKFMPELKGKTSIIRELHVYGTSIPVNTKNLNQFQHMGYGALLIQEAERIAREEHGSDKIVIISGVGVRHYYRKFGYTLDGPYMAKSLNEDHPQLQDIRRFNDYEN